MRRLAKGLGCALGLWASTAYGPDATVVRERMLTILSTSHDSSRRTSAVARLGADDVLNAEVIDVLRELILPTERSRTWALHADVSAEACRTLGRIAASSPAWIGEREAIGLLLQKAQDPQLGARDAAVEGIALIGLEKPVVREALGQAGGMGFPEEVRTRAIEILWLSNASWALPPLRAALDDRNVQVRLRACEALVGLQRPQDARAALQVLAGDRAAPRRVRERAQKILSGETLVTPPTAPPEQASCGPLLRIVGAPD